MTTTQGPYTLETLTVLGRLRGTPHLWLFTVLCLFFITVAGMQLTAVRQEINAPDLGFEMQRRAGEESLVGAFEKQRWAFENGDELLSIAGQPVTVDTFFGIRIALPVGPLKVKIRREGQVLELTGSVLPVNAVSSLASVMRWLTGVLLYLIAGGIFVMRPGAKLSWLFFLFLVQVGTLVLLSFGFPAPRHVIQGFLTLVFPLAPVTGFAFFSRFPTELRWARAAQLLALVTLVLWLLSLVTHSGFFAIGTPLSAIIRAFTLLAGLPLLGAIVQQWRLARKKNDQRLTEISRTLLVASFAGLFVPLLGNSLIRALGLEGGLAHQLTAVAVLVFAITTAAVLVRHNPLEIDRYGASVVGYVVTLGSLGAFFVMLLFTLPMVMERVGIANSSEALMAVTALTFISIGPMYRRLRRAVDRWFSREQADALKTSDVVRRVADSVQNSSREAALRHVIDAANVLGPELVALWQIDASGRSLHRVLWRNGAAEMPFIAREGPLERALMVAGAVAALGPASKLPADSQEALWALELAMTAPVRAHGVAIGFLGVGRRPSGFSYRSEDLSFLETLASQAGLALERGEALTRIGQYRIEKRLAQGGMAEVFVAWQLGPGGFERKVALKRLLPELAEDPASAAGLLDEARITARLQHPNIAQVIEVGLEAGQHFIAMEFVDGAPLRALISNRKRAQMATLLPVGLSIAKELLSALDHAHQLTDTAGVSLNVVHRDVTPANVLVSMRGEVKLVDFGLVMAATRLFRTQTGVARGTVPYMSPEQSNHEDGIDARADIYSAAATLYELLTNLRAYPDGPTGARPRSISEVNPILPPALDAVFEKAFAAAATERFDSAGAFWLAIRAATEGIDLAAKSDVQAWVRENRTQAEVRARVDEVTASATIEN